MSWSPFLVRILLILHALLGILLVPMLVWDLNFDMIYQPFVHWYYRLGMEIMGNQYCVSWFYSIMGLNLWEGKVWINWWLLFLILTLMKWNRIELRLRRERIMVLSSSSHFSSSLTIFSPLTSLASLVLSVQRNNPPYKLFLWLLSFVPRATCFLHSPCFTIHLSFGFWVVWG